MAPVIQELTRHPERIRSVTCATGQHREMLDQVLELFGIVPDIDLNLMQADQTLSELSSALLTALDTVMRDVKPRWVLAQGDTATVLVAAIVSYYHRVPFGHVEAGLRTGDPYRPFPEEMNRRVADSIAEYLFAPTEGSRRNLLREGLPDSRILVTGNTVIDALIQVANRPYAWEKGPLGRLSKDSRFVLITAHRRESFGEPFREICEAIRELAERFGPTGFEFVYPVHLNPNVRAPVLSILQGVPHLALIEPIDYLSLVQLMKRSRLILTDSGGIQEEAPTFRVPVLVMRDKTERPEGIDTGAVRLAGTSRDTIVREASRLLSDTEAWNRMAKGPNPYGDGRAATRIVDRLLETLP